MKKDIERVYLIDRYLKGELSGLTLDEFKSRLKFDPDFAAEVETQKAIIEGIKLARKEELLALLRGEKTLISNISKTQTHEQRVTDDSIIENATQNNKEEESNVYKLKPNYNNWFYAAVAVLLTPFIFYFVFIYFIKDNNQPISQNEVPTDQISTSDSDKKTNQNTNIAKDNTVSIPKDTTASNEKLAQNPENPENLNIEKDKKIDESNFSVANFQSINPVNNQEQTNNASTQTGENTLNVNAAKKLNNSNIKVEYWQSVVNFNGYKLEGNNLKLFGIKPDEKISLKLLDNTLYLKKKDTYYKLENNGNFEQYSKEINRETIKILESN